MNKTTIFGMVMIVLGFISSIIQKCFYGYVDAEGILHDSIFLPLSFIFVAIGVVTLIASWIIFSINNSKKIR